MSYGTSQILADKPDRPLTETEKARMRDDILRYGMAAGATWTDRQVRLFNGGALKRVQS